MQRPLFRDPPDVGARARQLRVALAHVLARAPGLPTDLPRFGAVLLGIEVGATRDIRLLIGDRSGQAVAALCMSATALVQLGGDDTAARSAVRVTVEPHDHGAARHRPALAAMASRLARATTPEIWRRARALAAELRALPEGVPLQHMRQIVAGVAPRQGLVRTGFRCNQDCGICWQGRDWPGADATQILTWIEDLHRAGARKLIISGGEPTLDRELDAYIRRARDLGFEVVTLETNAIACAKPGRAQRLADAGLSDAFVSLHSSDPDVSDAITRAPNTHARTLAGIDALLGAGVPVRLNCVLTRAGLSRLPELPGFIADRWRDHPSLGSVMLSLPSDPFDRSLLPELLPPPDELARALTETIEAAERVGVQLHGLDGPCGPPLCAFGADRRVTDLRPVPEAVDFRHHLPACDDCTVRGACFGVRDVWRQVHGDGWVRPITEALGRDGR